MGNKLALLRKEMILNSDQQRIMMVLEREEEETKRLIESRLGALEEDIVLAVDARHKIIETKINDSILKWIELETGQQEIFKHQQKTIEGFAKGTEYII